MDVESLVQRAKDKWATVENKQTVLVYAGGALVALWITSTIVSAVNSVPLVPRLLEIIGFAYTAWFVYRYLLFKSGRQELLTNVDELKSKVTGGTGLGV